MNREDDDDLPLGWRPGPYTAEELARLGVDLHLLTGWLDAARLLYPTLFAIAPELAAGFPYLRIEGYALSPGSLFGKLLPRGFRALVIACDPKVLGPSAMESRIPLQQPGFAGARVVFARLWRDGALLPCLTLRAIDRGAPPITVEGAAADARGLLRHRRLLGRIAAGGRPPGDPESKRNTVEQWERLCGASGMTQEQAAARVGATVRSLYRWKAMLRRASPSS